MIGTKIASDCPISEDEEEFEVEDLTSKKRVKFAEEPTIEKKVSKISYRIIQGATSALVASVGLLAAASQHQVHQSTALVQVKNELLLP